MKKTVTYVSEASLGEIIGIVPGCEVVSLGGKEDFDIIDYYCAQAEDVVSISYKMPGSDDIISKEIENAEYLPIGLSFEYETINRPRHCANKCIFCFMDQMPGGVRDTLVFKDDDYRLSFVDGNYITLTNVSDSELKRIVDLKLSPMNISVHTTNPQLRCEMTGNKNASKIMDQLRVLKDGEIDFNVQIVLCPEYNDKDELRRSLNDLLEFLPNLISLSVVPVGLTKYRDGLTPLRSFTKQEADETINIIAEYRQKAEEICGEGVFCASDEFFILAEREFPGMDYYGDFTQYENGVGMYVSFFDDMDIALEEIDTIGKIDAAVITGELGKRALEEMVKILREKDDRVNLDVITVKNEYFGGKVTASGLVTGGDILKTLENTDKEYQLYIMPSNMLNEDMLCLDDISLYGLNEKSGRRIIAVPFFAQGFLDALIQIGGEDE
ncbi:MAG: DUF512 domain-containing protein [Eubacteriaceae bacterium]|nr:DUF512 domain-containing protein [Eubacteriaceae bacterium]